MTAGARAISSCMVQFCGDIPEQEPPPGYWETHLPHATGFHDWAGSGKGGHRNVHLPELLGEWASEKTEK